VKRRTVLVASLVCLLALSTAASVLAGGRATHKRSSGKATFLAALVSDIGKFTDRSFNQSQL
jgi:basic membrane lipoprotein Med (substrate-binding protein (PBP1-ABC) superfamily)